MNSTVNQIDSASERNLGFNGLPELSWQKEKQTASLQALAGYVSNEAQKAINWYLAKKDKKKKWAQRLRVTAIWATAIAGLIPILAEIFNDQGSVLIAPAWAAVALIVAATCVGLDRFFGYSSAWMRFLTTEMQIRHTLHDFHMEWESRWAHLAGGEPTPDDVKDLMNLCRQFLGQLNLALKEEMETWVQEFSSAIQEIDKAARAQAEIMRLGGANITVKNGDKCEDGWSLSIDNSPSEVHHGKTAALRNLVPGAHTVTIRGVIDGKPVQAEQTFTVSTGSIANVELSVS